MNDPAEANVRLPKLGESPFHGKGWCYLDTMTLLERRIAGGLRVVTDRMTPPLRAFLAQTFFANTFYDILPWTALLQEAATHLGVTEAALVGDVALYRAEQDMNGINRLLLRLASPEKVVESIPKLATRYFDFVQSAIEVRQPRHYEIVARGIPKVMSQSYMAVTQGFLLHTLRLVNTPNPRHSWLPTQPDGERDGYPLVRVRRRIEWDRR